ncbi:MAG: hypothetical protein Q8T13_16365 [Acidobacteriota bacterium]|nr:hypothetical protein [Acidobacteriota bacterium]
MRPALAVAFSLFAACALAQSRPQPVGTDQTTNDQQIRTSAALEAIASELRQIREQATQARAISKSQPGPPVWSNWVLIVVTGGAVGAAFLSLGALRKQVDAAKVSADVAKETMLLTHRPRLIVRNVVVDGFDQGILDDKLTNCRVLIANTGTTKATLIKAHAEWLFAKHLPMENPVSKVHHPDQDPAVMGAGAIRTINMGEFSFDFDGHLTIFGEGEPHPRAPKIFVIGYVKYKDDLGILRRTYFGRQFDRVKRRFIEVDHPAYEYAD